VFAHFFYYFEIKCYNANLLIKPKILHKQQQLEFITDSVTDQFNSQIFSILDSSPIILDSIKIKITKTIEDILESKYLSYVSLFEKK